MKTLIVENTWLSFGTHGWGNGYVILPKGHIFHGVDYDSIPVDIHGGLTFALLLDEEALERYNLPKEDLGSWMIGFDTLHYNDTLDKWPKEAVQLEAERLLEQCK